ncbi:MAG: hypothetical protein WDZ82_03440 [Candidatus Paceibacterota bacterium]
MIPEFKSDQYRKKRGGYSRLFKIHCKRCDTEILTYQKDGPGVLERLYLDRIISPKQLTELSKIAISKISNLICPHCKSWLAVPYIYKKEKRKAYKLFVGAISKKMTRIKKVSTVPKQTLSTNENR